PPLVAPPLVLPPLVLPLDWVFAALAELLELLASLVPEPVVSASLIVAGVSYRLPTYCGSMTICDSDASTAEPLDRFRETVTVTLKRCAAPLGEDSIVQW